MSAKENSRTPLSPKGKKKVKEALEDIKKGRVKKLKNVEDLKIIFYQ